MFDVGVPFAEGEQAADGLAPAVGVLGQHGEPGADVLGAFGVVRGQGGHRQWPGPLRGGVGLVELVHRAVRVPGGEAGEVAGGAADLVQRDHPAVSVEGGVLDALGHDRPGGLLEADDELRRAGQGQLLDEADLACAQGQRLPGVCAGPHDVPAGLQGRRRARADVGAVDGEGGQHLGQCLVQADAGEVRAPPPGLGQREGGEPVQFGAQGACEYVDLGLAADRGEVGPDVGNLGVEGAERPGRGRVDEQPGEPVQRVVAGGAGARPGVGQRLTGLQDLFDDRPRAAGGLGQPAQVLLGVGEAVGVVDPQAVDRAGPDLVEDQAVGGGEDVRILLTQAGEGGDVEEAPVVQLGAGDPPEAQPVVLTLEGGGDIVRVDGPVRDG